MLGCSLASVPHLTGAQGFARFGMRALKLASLGLARLRCGVATGGVAGNLAGDST
jgi:hypothetical protein